MSQSQVGFKDTLPQCLLASFCNGKLIDNAAHIKATKSTSKKSRDKIAKYTVQSTEGSQLSYTGTPGTLDNEFFEHFVVVKDKASGKFTLFNAEFATFQPDMIKDGGSKAIDLEWWQADGDTMGMSEIPETAKEARKAKRTDLTAEFGSKRAQQNLRRMERNKLEATDLGAPGMASSSAIISPEKLERTFDGENSKASTPKPSTGLFSFVPAFNPAAQRPQDIYCLEYFLDVNERYELAKGLSAFKDRLKQTDESAQTSNLAKLTTAGIISRTGTIDDTKLSFVQYLDMLIRIAKHGLRNPFAIEYDALSDVPPAVMAKLYKLFLEDSLNRNQKVAKTRAETRDMLLSHIIVIGLLLNDLQVDLKDLVLDTGVRVERWTKAGRALGCVLIPNPKSSLRTLVLKNQPNENLLNRSRR